MTAALITNLLVRCIQDSHGDCSADESPTCECLETQCFIIFNTLIVAAVLITDSRFFNNLVSVAPEIAIKGISVSGRINFPSITQQAQANLQKLS